MKIFQPQNFSFPVLLILVVWVLSISPFNEHEYRISGDGIGYVDHLFSIIHYEDYGPQISGPDSLHSRFQNERVYVPFNGRYLNKYPVGVSVLLAPFVAPIYYLAHPDYHPQDPFWGKLLFGVSLFYLFWGLIFLGAFLKEWGFEKRLIRFLQFAVVFGTALFQYSYFQPAYSHLYSFFTLTGFLLFSKRFFSGWKTKDFILAVLFFGLTLLLRQVNGLVVVFLPLLMAKESIRSLIEWGRQNWRVIFSAGILLFLVLFWQLLSWHLQTGKWLVYSYQNEYFNFLQPNLLPFLFSYKKGFFLYHPIFVFSVIGAVVWFFQDRRGAFFWTLGMCLLVFVFASWWSWSYGASFGQRVMVDYYALWVLPIGFLFKKSSNWLRVLLLILMSMLIGLNLIQTYQYQSFILHWSEMDAAKYHKTFLKTSVEYEGWVWKTTPDLPLKSQVKFSFDQWEISPGKDSILFRDYTKNNENYNGAKWVKVSLSGDFNALNEAEIVLNIYSPKTQEVLFYGNNRLIHASEKPFGQQNKGQLYFEIPSLKPFQRITIRVQNANMWFTLDDVNIQFLGEEKAP